MGDIRIQWQTLPKLPLLRSHGYEFVLSPAFTLHSPMRCFEGGRGPGAKASNAGPTPKGKLFQETQITKHKAPKV